MKHEMSHLRAHTYTNVDELSIELLTGRMSA